MTATVHSIPQQLPAAIEAEKSLLGAILLAPRSLAMVADLVRATDFGHPVHAVLYQAMLALDEDSAPIDTISIVSRLEAAGEQFKLRHVGGETYLGELMTACVSVENIEYHARLIVDAARRNRSIAAADELRCLALRGEEGWDEAGGDAVFKALEQQRAATSQTAAELAVELQDEIERRQQPGAITGISTGTEQLDELLGGLRGGSQYVLAARPSLGKTSLACDWCRIAGLTTQTPSLIFSSEMTNLSLFERMVCAEARIDTQRMATGQMDGEDFRRLMRCMPRMSSLPIIVDQQSAPTLLDIRARARRWRASQTPEQQAKPALIVVDYLQLLDHQQGKGEKLTDAIGRTSRGLKGLAKDLRCATVVLSQLNRESERDNRRPRMSDLRDSGAIEADADAVVFLHRPDQKHESIVDATVGKNRNGPTGVAKLAFHRQWTRFDALTDRDLEVRRPSVAASAPPPASPPQRTYRTASFDAQEEA